MEATVQTQITKFQMTLFLVLIVMLSVVSGASLYFLIKSYSNLTKFQLATFGSAGAIGLLGAIAIVIKLAFTTSKQISSSRSTTLTFLEQLVVEHQSLREYIANFENKTSKYLHATPAETAHFLYTLRNLDMELGSFLEEAYPIFEETSGKTSRLFIEVDTALAGSICFNNGLVGSGPKDRIDIPFVSLAAKIYEYKSILDGSIRDLEAFEGIVGKVAM